MTVLNENQHKGEFITQLVDADRGDISVEGGTYGAGHDVPDGTPLIFSGANLVPAVGTVNTAGEAEETIVGLSYGHYDATNAAVKGAYVARLAVVDRSKINFPITDDGDASEDGIVAALKTLFIIAR